MSTSQDLEIDRIFSRSLELEGAECMAYLDRTCVGHPEVRAAVEELRRLAATGRDLLGDATAVRRERLLRDAEVAYSIGAEGSRIGPWEVVKELGQGGMGVVYLARRADGEFDQQVALKVIRLDAGAQHRARFARERQILANLDHPGIARLLDGGVSENGWPYLAMEYVDGQRIDTLCDERGLPVRARLELFLEVCAAVTGAHRQLVVHRDIKPSNILVTEEGRVKLLDFGIAKLLGEGRAVAAELTQDAARVMTPAYASPEQFRGEAITVASDVYQLGLLLFRLLTGRLPYDVTSLSPSRAEKLICETPAPRASTVAIGRQEEQGSQQTLKEDGTHPQGRELRGDLDTILGKALEKQPAARYASVEALASDLRRHLNGLPIKARSPTWGYRTGKFLARHRWAVASAVLVVFLGLSQTLAYTIRLREERDQAQQARDESRELTHFLVDLFEINDPERPADEPVNALALMERAVERLDSDLAPLVRARFLHTTGEIYTKLALWDRATQLSEEALRIRRSHLSPNHPELLVSITQLGLVYSHLERFDEAGVLLEEVLAARRKASTSEPAGNLLAAALNNLGNLRFREGRVSEAEPYYREALEIRERVLPPNHPQLMDSVNNFGVVLQFQGRNAEAVPHLKRATELFGSSLGPYHPQRAVALNNLSLAESSLGRFEMSGQHIREARDIWAEAYGPDHPRTLRASQNLGSLMRRTGNLEQALAILREVLERQRSIVSPSPLEMARTLNLLGIVYTDRGNYDLAADAMAKAFTIRRDALGIDHRLTLSVRSQMARLDFLQGRVAEAETAHFELLKLKERVYGPQHFSTAWTLHHLALTLVHQGRGVEARPLLERALEIRRTSLGETHPETVESRSELASLLG